MFDSSYDNDLDEAILSSLNEETKSPAKHSTERALLPPEKNSKLNDIELSKKPRNSSTVSRQTFVTGMKRKFPGPAGILPERNGERNENLEESSSSEHPSFCSQRSYDEFLEGAWIQMKNEFSSSDSYLPDKYNISWIKTQARLNKLNNQKAPFLAAIIETLEVFDGKIPTVNVTLKDKSGDIQATILHDLYEEYSNELTVGSVLILKQFGVLAPRYQSKYYLTITPKNLVSIYSHNKIIGTNEYTNSKINVQNLTVNQIITSLTQEELLSKSKKLTSSPHPDTRSPNNHVALSNRSVNNSSPGVEKKFNFKHAKNKAPRKNSNIFEADCSDISLSLDLDIPDNLNLTTKANLSVLDVRSQPDSTKSPKNVLIISNCSQISVQAKSAEESKVWESLFEDVDTSALFDDF